MGIWGYSSDAPEVAHHDSGAALIADGRVLAAVNEERFTRNKNEGRWPQASIRYVLDEAALDIKDVALVGMAGLSPLPRAVVMGTELLRAFLRTGSFLPNRWLYALLTAKKLRRVPPAGTRCGVRFVDHHTAHAASAFFTSGFERAAVVTLDGIGDSAWCGGVWRAQGTRLECLRRFTGYASPGLLYSYVTKSFGFRPARHEGKVTGLAAYGDPERLLPEFRGCLSYCNRRLYSDFIPTLFRARVDAEWESSWIDRLLDSHSREDIAAALQRHTEEIVVAIVKDAVEDTGLEDVAVAGGVFANVAVNRKVRENISGRLWIHPNMGDGGLGLGAACFAARTHVSFPDVFLGPSPSPAEEPRPPDFIPKNPARFLAEAVAAGRVVGVVRGRMEYGPRALGHRSIFVKADDASINESLNRRLKRTEFMPFAPIMTETAARRFLRNWNPGDRPSRFMTITYDVTEDCRRAAPAVVHVDGTARPQVVSGDEDPFLKEFLEEYGRLAPGGSGSYGGGAGTEIVVNTSFNVHEEPIVCSVEDALRSLERGAVDLVLTDKGVYGSPAEWEEIS